MKVPRNGKDRSARRAAPASKTSRRQAASAADRTARARRVSTFRACAQAYAHLKAHRLVSETVVDTLQQIIREAES
ncbi:hypothetical protein ORV05_05340 [Amycolatopsis cynarae]|uniref:Uncharacterized protein n=1 Tax=Amycolatopsis cynarae TaxID=2995223 RepID=A0ABY7B7P6_9PSEU|nr:hypothetical protein [Amycolatopsis sp. HUAS 11-8]WAL67213.1 hypothetical protein ORV05_05340 [Amycolatopsis sp. HUAS 11-8]